MDGNDLVKHAENAVCGNSENLPAVVMRPAETTRKCSIASRMGIYIDFNSCFIAIMNINGYGLFDSIVFFSSEYVFKEGEEAFERENGKGKNPSEMFQEESCSDASYYLLDE